MSKKAAIAIGKPTERLQRLKLQLCHEVKKAWRRQQWNQIQAACYCGSSRSCVSKVDRLKIDELSVAQLFRFLACAAPQFEILISQ